MKDWKAYFWYALLTMAMLIASSCDKDKHEEEVYCECTRTNRTMYLDSKFKTESYDLPFKVECQEEVTEWTTYEFIYDRDLDQSIEKQFIITCK